MPKRGRIMTFGIVKKIGSGVSITRIMATQWVMSFQGRNYVLDLQSGKGSYQKWAGKLEFGDGSILATGHTAEATALKIVDLVGNDSHRDKVGTDELMASYHDKRKRR